MMNAEFLFPGGVTILRANGHEIIIEKGGDEARLVIMNMQKQVQTLRTVQKMFSNNQSSF